MGEIITFYSYKGGTGRTMALANVAWILAASGYRVLVVDWDLEAPGLHRYFHPFLRDKELLSSPGVIDLVIDFAVEATTPAPDGREGDAAWYEPLADVLRYAVSVDVDFGRGQLDLLPAGQQTPAYATRVNSFNWDNFYERLGGGTFLKAVRASMQRHYHYVLIDSRTGVSDTSGICTVQMPDKVVVCFTLNRQSIEGAAAVSRSIVEARDKAGRAATPIFPVPTRVERGETHRLAVARSVARQRFDGFVSHVGDATARTAYWDEIEVPYQTYYAYEEVLAVFHDESKIGTLLYAMERLAARLTGGPSIAWTMPPGTAPETVVDQWGWGALAAPAASQPGGRATAIGVEEQPKGPERSDMPAAERGRATDEDVEYLVYVSHAGDDEDLIARFVNDLNDDLRGATSTPASIFIDRRPGSGQAWPATTLRAPQRSRSALCLVSPVYVLSEWCGREFSVFLRQGIPIVPVLWEPVPGDLPAALSRVQMFDAKIPSRAMASGLRTLMRLPRYRDAYRQFVRALAFRFAELARGAHERLAMPISSWEEVPNVFAEGARSPAVVTLVVLAPAADEAGRAGLPPRRYGSDDLDWRPFGGETMVAMMQHAAAAERLRVRTLKASTSVPQELQELDLRLSLSLVLVDAAALQVPRLISTLAALGAIDLIRHRLLFVLTSPMPAIQAELLRQVAPRGGFVEAASDADLTTTLRRVLVQLRGEQIREAALRQSVPLDAPPRIVGPGNS